jgi:hypothetical protein
LIDEIWALVEKENKKIERTKMIARFVLIFFIFGRLWWTKEIGDEKMLALSGLPQWALAD